VNELQLASLLQEKLAPNYRKIYRNVSLASNKFYPYWKEWHGEAAPSAQPQIDLLMVDTSLRLLAAELKWFRKTGKGQPNLPFYAGLDESLALLRFGFMVVSLWHFFDEELDKEQVRRLYSSCESLVTNLDLPINYQAFTVTKAGRELMFWRLYRYSDARFELPTAHGKSNPLRENIDAKRIQDILRAVLKIPHSR